ncbi:unnamed protein product, partial [Nesidiocoris tenuis]
MSICVFWDRYINFRLQNNQDQEPGASPCRSFGFRTGSLGCIHMHMGFLPYPQGQGLVIAHPPRASSRRHLTLNSTFGRQLPRPCHPATARVLLLSTKSWAIGKAFAVSASSGESRLLVNIANCYELFSSFWEGDHRDRQRIRAIFLTPEDAQEAVSPVELKTSFSQKTRLTRFCRFTVDIRILPGATIPRPKTVSKHNLREGLRTVPRSQSCQTKRSEEGTAMPSTKSSGPHSHLKVQLHKKKPDL